MKLFLKKITLFISLIVFWAVIILSLDILRVYRSYDNYYKDCFVTLNRNFVSTKIYLKYRDSLKFNSFIFGSSRSQAFKTRKWQKYLPENSVPFHYDSQSESLYGVYKKLEFLNNLKTDIDNVLLIVDREVLAITEKRDTHLLMNPLEFNDISKFDFYSTNIKANLNPKFVLSYIDYSIFKKRRYYMKDFIMRGKYIDSFALIYNDSYYGYAKEIKEDSVSYYKNRIDQDAFYKRPVLPKFELNISEEEVELLKNIKTIFKNNDTNYKIVISPLYNQIPLEVEQEHLLNSIFGKDNVFNFSGVNKFTLPISNYFESSHYKPSLANKILDSIYKKPN